MKLYKFPQRAAFEKVLPKNKIYQHSSCSSRVKNLFVDYVEKIVWKYKLTDSTVNIRKGTKVKEIQILKITLRKPDLPDDVLHAIDKSIPSPIIFLLNHKNKVQYAAAYKRQSEADKNKWVVSSYSRSQWMSEDGDKQEIPVVLDMGVLYNTIIKEILPLQARDNESMEQLIERVDILRAREKEAEKLEKRIHREKQFKKKVEMNHELNQLKTEIEELKDEG